LESISRNRRRILMLALTAGALPAGAQEADTRPARIVAAALAQEGITVRYDSSYRRLGYPGGDVPPEVGVCTDVLIRAYRRALGIDLQQRVHDDMRRAWTVYPKLWNLSRPDPNVDHRRVPNLETFFRRHGQVLPVTTNPSDYRPGDIVSWRLPGGQPHIGLVTDRSGASGRPLVVHNIGQGVRVEDMLFDFKVVGHFRF
jgi:uncharacterized protein YijF (DUF1287 family)